MGRVLDRQTLIDAAEYYTDEFVRNREPHGRNWVLKQCFNFTFKDEFHFVVDAIREKLEARNHEHLVEWDMRCLQVFTPRSDHLLEELLEEKLAIGINGDHIPGKIGTVKVGGRVVGKRKKIRKTYAERGFWDRFWGRPARVLNTLEIPKNVYWPVYAGEGDERILEDGGVADPLPEGAEPLPLGATNTRISNEIALLMADACVDNVDSGSAAGIIFGQSGSQPTDPDTAISGTTLFILTLNDPAFGAAADDTPGGKATANAITSDTSANATGTLGYCRVSSSDSAETAEDDQIDGEAGTSGADFNFNTLAIVSGATVAMTAWTVTQPES